MDNSLFSVDRRHHPSRPAIIAEFAEVDALPSAEVQSSVRYRNRQAAADDCAFGVRRHVVVTFEGVLIVRLALFHQAVEDAVHVVTDIRVSILVYAQSATGMLDEQMQDSHFWQCRKVLQYLTRYEMEAAKAFF